MAFRTKTLISIAVVVMAVFATGAAAFAGALAPAPETSIPTPRENPIDSPNASLASHFAVLNAGSSRSSDAIPASAREQLGHADLLLKNRANLDLAAAVSAPGVDGPVLIIPGDNAICMFFSDGSGGYGGSCASEEQALAGWASVTIGSTTVSLVPDSVSIVRAIRSDGETSTARVDSNIAVNHLANPAKLALDDKIISLR